MIWKETTFMVCRLLSSGGIYTWQMLCLSSEFRETDELGENKTGKRCQQGAKLDEGLEETQPPAFLEFMVAGVGRGSYQLSLISQAALST